MARKPRKWTIKDLKELYRLRTEQNLSFPAIGKKLGRGGEGVRTQWKRINWKLFNEDPEDFMKNHLSTLEKKKKGVGNDDWTEHEMVQLYSYIKADMDMDFISEQLGRSKNAIEHKLRGLDISKFMDELKKAEGSIAKENIENKKQEMENLLKEKLVVSLLALSRHDAEELKNIKKDHFKDFCNFEDGEFPVSFTEIKKATVQRLKDLGKHYPRDLTLGDGTYVIFGDTHGKHSQPEIFSMLGNLSDHLKADRLIHIGHTLDDNNQLNMNLLNFDNLTVISKIEELKIIQESLDKINLVEKREALKAAGGEKILDREITTEEMISILEHGELEKHPKLRKAVNKVADVELDIIRESAYLGDVTVENQDMIRDYVKTHIKSLDTDIFDDKMIANCHRLEFFTRCTSDELKFIASPGCFCENHVIRTVKQQDFTDGRVVKQAYHEGFSSYRRMRHMCQYWEQGLIVVTVKNGIAHPYPCQIKKVKDGYATAYFDKIITSKGVKDPEFKALVMGDMHSPEQDNRVLDVIGQINKKLKPDTLVNIGDAHNYFSLNHHSMDKNHPIMNIKFLEESAQVYWSLEKMSHWAKDKHLLIGNHERFAQDFVKLYPQLEEYVEFNFVCDVDGLGYEITPLKERLALKNAQYVHGDVLMFKQVGQKIEKISRTFGRNTFMGHSHTTEIRMGAFCIGLTGLMDQGYNEPMATYWVHGLGFHVEYEGQSFLTSLMIRNDEISIGKDHYSPKNPDEWIAPPFTARLTYNFEKK